MRLFLLYAFLFLMVIPVLSQEITLNQPMWGFGISYSGFHSYRTLKGEGDIYFGKAYRDGIEIPAFGYCIGITGRYTWTKNFKLESGLHFIDQTFKTKEQSLISLYPDPEIPRSLNERFQHQYLQIPIRLNIGGGIDKSFVYGTIGLTGDVYLSNRKTTTLTYQDNHTEDLIIKNTSADWKLIVLGCLVGIGVDHTIRSRFTISGEVLYRQQLTPIYDSEPKQYNQSVGGQVSVLFNFKGTK